MHLCSVLLTLIIVASFNLPGASGNKPKVTPQVTSSQSLPINKNRVSTEGTTLLLTIQKL